MRSAAVFYAGCPEHTHQSNFLESCFLCQKPLGRNCDIFMYRGNTPFCSQECRQEQIEIDEAKEKRLKLSSGSKRSSALGKSSPDSNTKTSPNKAVQTGTVAVV